jgi:hypothetical protein
VQGVGRMKRYRKEGSEGRLRGDAGFANKANPPPQRAVPLRPCPLPLEQREEGGTGKGGGRGGSKGAREGRGRVASEGTRTRGNDSD